MKLYISRILVITLVIGVFIFDLMTPLGHMEWIMHEAAVDVHETAFGIDQTNQRRRVLQDRAEPPGFRATPLPLSSARIISGLKRIMAQMLTMIDLIRC